MKINLIELFEESVKKYPQKVAVIDKDREITFSDLKSEAVKLAQKLIYSSASKNNPVAVFLDKSIESVYSDLGIIYSGTCQDIVRHLSADAVTLYSETDLSK